MKKTFILLLFSCFILGFSQEQADTLQSWISKFHTINNLTTSPDGKLATIRKMYPNNIDTVLTVDLQERKIVDTILQMSGQVFLKNNSLLSSGNGKAQFNDYSKDFIKKYNNVKIADVLMYLNKYSILSRDGTMKLYDYRGKTLKVLPNIQQFVTDKKKVLFASQLIGKKYRILNVVKNDSIPLYSTESKIKQLVLSSSGTQLILTESDATSSKLKLIFIDTTSGKITYPNGIPAEDADHIDISEVKGGKAYVINFVNYYPPPKNMLVDIWYGNDYNLAAKQSGKVFNKYYLWKPTTNQSINLPQSYPFYSPIDSDRFILAFNPLEEFKNITLHPYLNIKLYDMETGHFREIFHQVKKDLIHSSLGKYIIALDPKNQTWQLFNTEMLTVSRISKHGLKNPVFTKDFKSIYFESDTGMYRYTIRAAIIQHMGISKESEILNADRKTTNPMFGFKMSMIDSASPVLIRTVDRSKNLTAFSTWYNEKNTDLIPQTANRIREIKYDRKMEKLFTVEENYNMAPKIYEYSAKKEKRREIISVKDQTAAGLKQKIVSYKNSIGTPLKGVLYYPQKYNPQKMYPMVVYIYQIKSSASNVYSLPSNEATAVNRRTLLENGYFVYEPDIIFDSRGTGLSALDCVHSALDAIIDISGINFSKVGLTGHSMGGYETNFIATQSSRFAAFISGAALSDMVSTYFSYDYAEQKPNHNRFETGQFEMQTPYSTNKELYLRNSPINYVENVKAPVLIWNGMRDDVVVPSQAMEFFIGLKRNDLPVIALFYPGRGHDLGLNTDESKEMNKKALEWWNYFLKEKRNSNWIKL